MANSETSNAATSTRLPRQLRVLLADPSLFTPTYDKALSDGLAANGVQVAWALRGTRAGEDEDDLAGYPEAVRFYRFSESGRGNRTPFTKVLKGIEHWYGLRELAGLAHRYDVVHFQWTPLPILDVRAIERIRKTTPVVLTVHDVLPLNGASGVQVKGFDRLFEVADRLVVHTSRARNALMEKGVTPNKISVIAHGPLALRCAPKQASARSTGRWRIVLFGRLKPYKGVDLLVEALGRLSPEARSRIEVIVAGEPTMATEPLLARATSLGIDRSTLEFVFKRLTDIEMSDLLTSADAFIFPYRTIDASGVLFLVAGMHKWLIASPLGAFNDVLEGRPSLGVLVDPEDSDALARAMVDSIGRRPTAVAGDLVPSWQEIGAQTLELYRSLVPSR